MVERSQEEEESPETRKSPEGLEEAKGLGSCGRKERGKLRESERVGASTTGGEPSLLITDKDTHGLLQRTDHGTRRLIRPVATLQEYPLDNGPMCHTSTANCITLRCVQ